MATPTPVSARSQTPAPALPGPELTIVVPTLNEADNVEPLIERLEQVLRGIHWEVIFVDDDSTDRTRPAIARLARGDARIRLLHRIGRRGLSSACIEGIQASTAPFVAIMDADLQHDDSLLPRMLAALRAGTTDIAVGSRYVSQGDVEGWDTRRARLSGAATRLAQLVTNTRIADPMSGFFMLRRDLFDRVVRRLSAVGFKILLDILASSEEPLRVQEFPYHFRERLRGQSKLDTMVVWEYALLLADKTVGRIIPVRFVLFAGIGLLGLGVHLLVLWSGLHAFGVAFPAAQATATGVAMVANFALNNWFTYHDRRLRGWRFVRGLISFVAVCAVGAVANVGLASVLFGHQQAWWLAGIAGAIMSSVWNYAVSSVFTWKTR